MRLPPFLPLLVFLALGQAAVAGPPALVIFGAGTLAAPFKTIEGAFAKLHPGIDIQAQFGGSVKMVKQVTELRQPADVVAVADYNVIPKYLFGEADFSTDWYVGFATNAITFVYTDRSRYADEINAGNWYKVLSRPGVEIGRSNPDTDPSGYQTVQMLELAEKRYNQPGLTAAILANSPRTNMRETETELIAALQAGEIDYLAIYLSDARQHGFRYLDLLPEINLSDARFASSYRTAVAQTSNGPLPGRPIVYGVTIPGNAPHPDLARAFLQFLLGDEGRKVMEDDGFGSLAPAYVNDLARVPEALKPLVIPWP